MCFYLSGSRKFFHHQKVSVSLFDCSALSNKTQRDSSVAQENCERLLASVAVCAEEPDVRTRKIVKVVTQTMVDGKVVDESSEVEQIEETRK